MSNSGKLKNEAHAAAFSLIATTMFAFSALELQNKNNPSWLLVLENAFIVVGSVCFTLANFATLSEGSANVYGRNFNPDGRYTQFKRLSKKWLGLLGVAYHQYVLAKQSAAFFKANLGTSQSLAMGLGIFMSVVSAPLSASILWQPMKRNDSDTQRCSCLPNAARRVFGQFSALSFTALLIFFYASGYLVAPQTLAGSYDPVEIGGSLSGSESAINAIRFGEGRAESVVYLLSISLAVVGMTGVFAALADLTANLFGYKPSERYMGYTMQVKHALSPITLFSVWSLFSLSTYALCRSVFNKANFWDYGLSGVLAAATALFAVWEYGGAILKNDPLAQNRIDLAGITATFSASRLDSTASQDVLPSTVQTDVRSALPSVSEPSLNALLVASSTFSGSTLSSSSASADSALSGASVSTTGSDSRSYAGLGSTVSTS